MVWPRGVVRHDFGASGVPRPNGEADPSCRQQKHRRNVMPPITDIEQEQFDYATAEGFSDLVKREREWHSWTVVGVGLAALIGLLAMVVGLVALTQSGGSKGT